MQNRLLAGDEFALDLLQQVEATRGQGHLTDSSVLATGLVENQFEIDVRRDGGVIDPDFFEAAILANSRILQSHLGYGEDGQEVPQNAVMIMKAPITLLDTHGGILDQSDAERRLRAHMPSAGLAVIDFEFPASELTGSSTVTGQIDLSWTWEGDVFSYNVYRRDSPSDEYSLLTTVVTPAEGTINHTDPSLAPGAVFYYTVRVTQGGTEFPAGNSLAVKVI